MYTPQLREVQIRKLYKLKLETGKAMTKLMAEAVEFYIASLERLPPAKRDGEEGRKDEAPESK